MHFVPGVEHRGEEWLRGGNEMKNKIAHFSAREMIWIFAFPFVFFYYSCMYKLVYGRV